MKDKIYCKNCKHIQRHYDMDSGEPAHKCHSPKEIARSTKRLTEESSTVFEDQVEGIVMKRISFITYRDGWWLLTKCREKNINYDCAEFEIRKLPFIDSIKRFIMSTIS